MLIAKARKAGLARGRFADKVGQSDLSNDEERRQKLVKTWRHIMKHERGRRIVEELENSNFPSIRLRRHSTRK